MAANIVRLYDSTLLNGVEVSIDAEEDRTALFQLNYGPPQACTWSNGFCKVDGQATLQVVDLMGAKAFIEAERAKKFCQREEPLTDGKLFWAVMFEGEVLELAYDSTAASYLGKDQWSRQDGEPGCFDRDEIFGWCKTQHHAEAAAKCLTRAIGYGW